MKTIVSKAGCIAAVLAFATVARAESLQLKAFAIHADVREANSAWTQATGALALVEWKSAITEAEKAALAEKGVTLVGYVPQNAFLAYLGEASPATIAALPFVRRVLRYRPEMKIDPELARAQFSRADSHVWTFVELRPGGKAETIANYFSGALIPYGPNAYLGRIAPGLIWEAAQSEEIVWLEGFAELRPLALSAEEVGAKDEGAEPATPPPLTGFESGTKVIRAEAAYAAGFTGRGQIVGVADTGLDKGDLATLIPDFQGQVFRAHAVALGGRSWADPLSHGTHVAGSIAGKGASSEGAIRGTAWGAQLLVEGMWSDMMNNIFPPSVDVLFKKAYDDGARIHSNSWGRPAEGRYDALARQVDTFLFNHQDLLAVFAAGNDGADLNQNGVVDEGSLGTPATAKNVITVGASKNLLLEGGIQKPMKELRDGLKKWGTEPLASSRLSEDVRGMAAFSSRGPTADGRIKPDVVAPGTNIVSARSSHPNADVGWGAYNEHYLYMGGTSMATPLASGALAVMREFLVKRLGTERVSAALLKAFAMNSAFDLYPGQFTGAAQEHPRARPNNHQGSGRIDLASAITGEAEGRYEFHDKADGLATGGEYVVEWTNAGTKATKVRVTLAYTDAPPAGTAQLALVNDLDLELVTPSGRKVYPNGGGQKDSRNNVEAIDLDTQEAGKYRLIVRAANVPQGQSGKQPFALVVYR